MAVTSSSSIADESSFDAIQRVLVNWCARARDADLGEIDVPLVRLRTRILEI